MAGQPKGIKKGLRAIAADLGYSPGEYTIRHISAMARALPEWKQDIDRGVVPDDVFFAGDSISRATAKWWKEHADLKEDERKWVDFFEARMKAIEVSGGDQPLRMEIAWETEADSE